MFFNSDFVIHYKVSLYHISKLNGNIVKQILMSVRTKYKIAYPVINELVWNPCMECESFSRQQGLISHFQEQIVTG